MDSLLRNPTKCYYTLTTCFTPQQRQELEHEGAAGRDVKPVSIFPLPPHPLSGNNQTNFAPSAVLQCAEDGGGDRCTNGRVKQETSHPAKDK